MTRERAAHGVPTDAMAAYYARRSDGGVGLIITEGAPPDLAGSFGSTVPRFYGDDALAGWARLGAAVRLGGASVLAQLWHVGAFDPSLIGMQNSHDPSPERLSPSGLAAPGRPLGRAMTIAEIDASIAAFGAATAAAVRMGFAGIEIHGAHGYLPDQFLWAPTNQRTDAYGGNRSQRTRFACELIRECRRQAGDAGVISFRLSQWKQLDYQARLAESPGELAEIVEPLADAGVDLFHCSTRRFWEPAFADSPLGLAAWVRRLSGKAAIAVGSVTLENDFKSATGKTAAPAAPEQIQLLEQGLGEGHFDLIAIGRALLANPDWAQLVEAGHADALRGFARADLDALR